MPQDSDIQWDKLEKYNFIIRGFPTRMVYLYYISCLRYTILVGNPRFYMLSSFSSISVKNVSFPAQEEKNGVKNVRESQLNLVDLAGSERQKDTNTVGIRLKASVLCVHSVFRERECVCVCKCVRA